jgi:hypothetical protein
MWGDENLVRELGIKKREVLLLSRLQTLKSQSESHSKFMKSLIEELTKAFNAGSGIALVYDPSKRKIKITQRFGIDPKSQKCKAVVKKLAREAIRSNQPIMYNRILNECLIDMNVRNIFILPIKINRKTAGAIQIINKKNSIGFTSEDISFFNAVSPEIDLAVEESLNQEKMSKELKTASLLYNFERAKNLGSDVFDAISTQLVKNTSAELCIIMRINKRKWEAESMTNSRLAKKVSSAKLKEIAEEAVSKKKILLVDDMLSVPFKDKSGAVILFSKFGFSDYEIDFIESTMKKIVF